jgi:hypothetical protein
MSKYLVLYNATVPASEFMAQSSPEQMKAGMADWMAWRDEVVKTMKFEFGMPVQALSRITPDGVTDSNNQTSGYSIMESDSKEAVLEALKKHPHLQRPGATIDVLEMLVMPGMEQ